jgi:hypothetical protein
MPNNNPLNAVEQQSIAKAILNIINTNYQNLPVSKMQYQSLDTRKSSMAIYNLSTSAVDKLYVNGNYLATYRFSIVYRSIPTNTNKRADCEEILNSLAYWLLSLNLNSDITLTNGRTIDNISITSPPVLYKQYGNGSEDYHVIFSLKYKKEV